MKKRTVILLLSLTLVLSLGLTGCKKKSSHKTSNNDDEVVLTQTGNCSDGTWDELCASFDLLVDEYAELSDLDDETDIMSTLSEEEEKSVAQAADVINNFADTQQNNYSEEEAQALIKQMDDLGDALEEIMAKAGTEE